MDIRVTLDGRPVDAALIDSHAAHDPVTLLPLSIGRFGVPSHDQPDTIAGTPTACRRISGRVVRCVPN
ncbi:hypothetical protein [Streptomyces sp. OE57]|uniref:hypothetical protein n=1 Tax=Streptomyces lacaronensis TaxID=3379885 RepID=UPI0039B79213